MRCGAQAIWLDEVNSLAELPCPLLEDRVVRASPERLLSLFQLKFYWVVRFYLN